MNSDLSTRGTIIEPPRTNGTRGAIGMTAIGVRKQAESLFRIRKIGNDSKPIET